MKKTKLMAAVVLVALFAVLLCACGGGGVNMEDYVTVEFTGANGYGRADIDFDEDALVDDLLKDHEKALKKAAKKSEIYDGDAEFYAETLAELFYVRTEAENLSNKDKITVNVLFDGSLEKVKKETGLKFKNTELKFTVSGLGEVEELDVFENMEMKISGISPNLSVSFSEKETGKYGFYVKYSLAANAPVRYKIGDTVNVKASFSSGEDLAHGYIVNQLEKSIVITPDMAEQYISNAMDFDTQTIEDLRATADKEAIEYFTAENNKTKLYGNYLKLSDAESVGQAQLQNVYLCYSENPGLKVPDYSAANNFLCFVYKFNISNANYTGYVRSDIRSYDGDAYAYVFIGNITRFGENIYYDLDDGGFSTDFFASEEELRDYLVSKNYTISEVSGF